MTQPEQLTIVRIDLIDQSMRSWTALTGGHSEKYPLLVWLSRRLDDFERHALAQSGFTVGQDPMTVVLPNITLEDFRTQKDGIIGQINLTAEYGRQQRHLAQTEDAPRNQLADEINKELHASRQ